VFKIHIVVWVMTPSHLIGRYWVMLPFIQVLGLWHCVCRYYIMV